MDTFLTVAGYKIWKVDEDHFLAVLLYTTEQNPDGTYKGITIPREEWESQCDRAGQMIHAGAITLLSKHRE